MTDNYKGSKIAKNTLFLYVRQIFIMFVSLYTVRVVVNVLGIVDYGIYSVVSGIVSMFGIVSGAMATSSQRFFSFELGRNDYDQLTKTFSINIVIYITISFVVLIFAETFGLWFLNTKIVIPIERMDAARLIYQFTIISFLITLMTTPYMAILIAHEKMNIYAYVSIVEVCLKLILVLLLKSLIFDKLSLYGFLILLVTLTVSIIYFFITKNTFPYLTFKYYNDPNLFKKIFSYTSWNFFGAGVSIAKNQVLNILLNMSHGPAVNAARTIASQVSSAVMSFSSNFSMAARPQIIKKYSSGDHDNMINLVLRSSKATAYLMYIFVLPLYLEMPIVIKLWLGEIPLYVVSFTRLILIDSLIESISYPLMSAAQATGRIKVYQSVVGGILLLNLPLSYMALKIGSRLESVFIISIIMTSIAFAARLVIVKKLVNFKYKEYFQYCLIPVLCVFFLGSIIPIILVKTIKEGIGRLFVTILVSIAMTVITILVVGITKREREIIYDKIVAYNKSRPEFKVEVQRRSDVVE